MAGNSRSFYGSINLTALLEHVRTHSAFRKAGEKQQIYANAQLWLNAEPDDKGNMISITLSSDFKTATAEQKEAEKKRVYIGNFKESERKADTPVSAADVAEIVNLDDLPF